jgi:hypothetical protein
MREELTGIDALEAVFDAYGFPPEMLADYDQMECLSSRRGRETFLMRRRADGALAVAKCYDRAVFPLGADDALPDTAGCPGVPEVLGRYENERYLCVVRAYVEGVSLAEYVRERELSQAEIVEICLKLCGILDNLHSRPEPVIHRDVKPENVILTPGGDVCLIDFDTARTFKPEAESDTLFFGTKGYAAPEQYGFAQTDARTDEYSLGVLLRFLLTGSVRKSPHVRLYRPLEKIIDRCTAFAPEKRYPDMKAVARALRAANPRARFLRVGGAVLAALALCALLSFGGVKLYRHLTYTPFTPDHIPAFATDEARVADALDYMHRTYGTTMFDASDDVATIGDLRSALMELYGLERDYVYGINTDMPQESEAFFLPWGWDDGQTVDRDIAVYAAVKAHDPAIVADWSGLKDDNGFYPGVRVAVAFAEKTGITTGANRPGDIPLGELALIFANTDRVFAAAAAGATG